jgi:phosphoketolase
MSEGRCPMIELLPKDSLARMDAYFRAVNYLSVDQM